MDTASSPSTIEVNCRICGGIVQQFIDFGSMPMANAFVTADDEKDKFRFNLAAGGCRDCGMVQLMDQPPPDRMFNSHYPFYTASSIRMKQHFSRFAQSLQRDHLSGIEDPFVLEIGCNDGTFLEYFAKNRVRHLGIDASDNVVQAACKLGVTAVTGFFSSEMAATIAAENGQCDAVTAANALCHIPDLNDLFQGVSIILKDDGVFIFEDPYLGEIFRQTAFDQFYDEHVFYFSIESISFLAARNGFEIVDLELQPTHGGSMRFTLVKKNHARPNSRCRALIENEKSANLTSPATFGSFHDRCALIRTELTDLLEKLRADKKRIAGYAAASKSTTVINYCGISRDHLDYICDTTQEKWGRLSPGARIPVEPHETFARDYPDYALLFAWNHREEIRAKEKKFLLSGGRWIEFVPRVAVLEE